MNSPTPVARRNSSSNALAAACPPVRGRPATTYAVFAAGRTTIARATAPIIAPWRKPGRTSVPTTTCMMRTDLMPSSPDKRKTPPPLHRHSRGLQARAGPAEKRHLVRSLFPNLTVDMTFEITTGCTDSRIHGFTDSGGFQATGKSPVIVIWHITRNARIRDLHDLAITRLSKNRRTATHAPLDYQGTGFPVFQTPSQPPF